MKTIGVLGCGWLGFPLAKELQKNKYKVYGTTTTVEKIEVLDKNGIIASKISLFEDTIEGEITEFLKNIDVLILNVPPRLRGAKKENFVKKMTLLHATIKKTKCVPILFISSTAVYGNTPGVVTEETVTQPNTESGRQLVLSEEIFFKDPALQTTVIRFGGLIGPNRHPVTMLSKKENLTNGKAAVNLIHLDDCISIIINCIYNNWWNKIINGVYPLHPTKEEYYTKEAMLRGIKAPKYIGTSGVNSKKVNSNWLINVKKYHFQTSINSNITS